MDASPRSSMIRSKELGDQTPVVFRNRKGLRLYGILHTPHGRQPGDLAVVLLSPGVKMRVGPQRLYLPMTKRFLSLGLSVLRLDFHGLGDSDGTLPEEQLRDVYNHIEVGRFVEDTDRRDELDAADARLPAVPPVGPVRRRNHGAPRRAARPARGGTRSASASRRCWRRGPPTPRGT